MAVPTPTYTVVDLRTLVDQLEPDRLTKPIVVYETRKPKRQSPEQPGKKYTWAPELPDDDDTEF